MPYNQAACYQEEIIGSLRMDRHKTWNKWPRFAQRTVTTTFANDLSQKQKKKKKKKHMHRCYIMLPCTAWSVQCMHLAGLCFTKVGRVITHNQSPSASVSVQYPSLYLHMDIQHHHVIVSMANVAVRTFLWCELGEERSVWSLWQCCLSLTNWSSQLGSIASTDNVCITITSQ